MKDTIFQSKRSINCDGYLVFLDEPCVMGILNVTPDSFYDGGKLSNEDDILSHAAQMLDEGATFIDVGGYSSRPGAKTISVVEEKQRVIPAITLIHKNFPKAIISVDTFRSGVAQAAVVAGATVINDISAGKLDANMLLTVAELQVPYIAMHMKGTPDIMQKAPTYSNIMEEITIFLSEVINQAFKLGINDVIIDPGFGFGKTVRHNYEILSKLSELQSLNAPILCGLSRKSMFYKPLQTTPKKSLNATTAAHMIALQNGASILRVHDVKEAIEAIKIHTFVKNQVEVKQTK